jgi:hypothetical protein
VRRWSAPSASTTCPASGCIIYTAATPEYGKLTFFERFDREVDRVKAAYLEARDEVKGGRMSYSEWVAEHIPIGSGVTEAACKVLGVQGAGEAAAVRLGDAVEGAWGGGAVAAMPDLHGGAVVAILVAGRPQRLPGGGVTRMPIIADTT